MHLAEPSTLLTDYLLAAWAFVLALRLGREKGPGRICVRLWSAAFYASAAAALAGGSWHGFAAQMSPLVALLLWKATVYAVGLAGLALFCGAVFATCEGSVRNGLVMLAVLKFVLYAFWMSAHNAFLFVIYDYAPDLLGVLLLSLYGAWRRRDRSALWIAAGVLIAFAAAGVQRSGPTLATYFTRNDLYHVIQMGSFWLLYRGGRLLRDR